MQSKDPRFTSPSPSVETRVNALLGELTRDEKLLMLGGQGMAPGRVGDTFGCERLGIPSLKMADASVGVHWWTDRSTTYPATIALAASWDTALAYAAGQALGRDARARGIHIVLGPGVNIYRSPLCGRNFEYMGEDPCLAAGTVTAFIRGLQDRGVCATVKHYALNYQEFNRHHVSSDVDERTLREVYLPAFRAAIEDAGAGAIMTAYNLVNGVHASEHSHLIQEVLKGEWGFQGLVMSDWVSTYSAVQAANAGLDLEMPTAKWLQAERLEPALENGLVDARVLDDKVRRLLRLMVCFGWLDHAQQDTEIPIEDDSTAAVSLDIARRGCVLLKNEGGLLPLDPGTRKRIAVIGPHAEKTPEGGGGSALNTSWRSSGILAAMRDRFGDETVMYAPGIIPDDRERAFREARFETTDGAAGLVAAYFDNPDWLGEPCAVRSEARLEQRWPGGRIVEGIDPACFSVRWRGVIRPDKAGEIMFYQWFMGPFRVTVDGKVLFNVLDGEKLTAPRVCLPVEAGQALAVEVLYRCNPVHNAACFGWFLCDPDAAREAALVAARSADAVVYCCGFTDFTEGEQFDREFAMPTEHEQLLQAVAEVNPRTVVVVTAGGNIDMERWIDRVAGLLYAWYPGQEGGHAVAAILAGDCNPSGKLPASFERRLEDRSSYTCYHDTDGDGRVLMADGVFGGYRHHDRSGIPPRFAFGFGLSYTTYTYENLTCPDTLPAGDTCEVTLDVVNTGPRDGTEIVQLYLRDEEARVPRPVKELKAYAAVALKAGERRRVRLTLAPRDLAYFCPHRRAWTVEPGLFTFLVGASAQDIRLQGTCRVG